MTNITTKGCARIFVDHRSDQTNVEKKRIEVTRKPANSSSGDGTTKEKPKTILDGSREFRGQDFKHRSPAFKALAEFLEKLDKEREKKERE